MFKQLPDSHSVVGRLCDVLNLNKPDLDEAKYIIQFLSIFEKQRILRKHNSNDQKNMVGENKKNNYSSMSPVKKQALLENLELKYKEQNPIKKQTYLANLHLKYNEMDPTKKQILLVNLHLKYKEMSPMRKKIFLEKQAMVYKAMDSSKKEAYSERNRANMKRKYRSMNEQPKKFKSSSEDVNLDHCISKFQSRTKEGSYYICSVCNRLLYRKSVKLLEKKNYSSVPNTLFTDIASFDNKEYICVTCHSKIVKGKIPCQAVYNVCPLMKFQQNLLF